MAIITGTASITANTKAITIDSLDDGATLVGVVVAGNELQFIGENAHYHIETNPPSNSALTLLETYGGVTKSAVEFQIFTGYHSYNLIRIDPTMSDSYYSLQRNFERIATELTALGSSSDETQILNKVSIGVPVQGTYFGYQKFTSSVEISKLIVSTITGETTDEAIVLDLEINGTLQNLNLTVDASGYNEESGSLTYTIAAGQAIRLYWRTVPAITVSNWNVDVYFQNTSGSVVYYDFQKTTIGNLYVNQIVGKGYKPPNRNKVFALSYELDETAEGSDIVLELLDNDEVSYGSPVLITIPENSKTGYLEYSQKEYLTTETCNFKVNQVGSIVPGNNLKITIHSYHTYA